MNNSFLLKYYLKCKNKEIIIGNELLSMLEILKKDLDNDNYIFDTKEAHKRIKFIEAECKHSISPFAGQKFILELWQKAIIETIYSFYIKDADNKMIRRFTRVLLLIGRKNGKSGMASALANAEFFCGLMGTNILCASNDDEQTNILFNEINNMREESTNLEKISRKNIKGIFMGGYRQKNKKGKFSYQNKAKIKKLTIRTGAKEGRNLDFAILDEIHEFKDNTLSMSIWQSMSTKDEPLMIEISTEGFTPDGYLDNLLIDARQVLKEEKNNNNWLVWLYTQDNQSEIWLNKESWVKSNPNLGISKKWKYLEDLTEQAKTNASTRAFMLSKEFNIKQSSAQSWLNKSDIDANDGFFSLEEFRGQCFIGSVDLAETTDLCSLKLLFKKINDPRTYFYSHYWIPALKLKNSGDDVDYTKWQQEGYLTIVEGNSIDTSILADFMLQLCIKYNFTPFMTGYDNRFSKDFLKKHDEHFGEKLTINVIQKPEVLNNPMRKLEADFRSRLIVYNKNPIDYWCFNNTGIKLDSMERIIPCKIGYKKRIDGTASAIIAYAVLDWYKSTFINLL